MKFHLVFCFVVLGLWAAPFANGRKGAVGHEHDVRLSTLLKATRNPLHLDCDSEDFGILANSLSIERPWPLG